MYRLHNLIKTHQLTPASKWEEWEKKVIISDTTHCYSVKEFWWHTKECHLIIRNIFLLSPLTCCWCSAIITSCSARRLWGKCLSRGVTFESGWWEERPEAPTVLINYYNIYAAGFNVRYSEENMTKHTLMFCNGCFFSIVWRKLENIEKFC